MGYEEFERQQANHARIERKDLTRALRSAGVRGYSRLKIDELRDLVDATPAAAEAVDALRRERAIAPRWALRRALGVSYGELADIESRAGVEPGSGRHGEPVYGMADAHRIFEVADGYKPDGTWVHVRVTVDGAGADLAADRLIERIEKTGGRVLNRHDYPSRENGSMMRYFDVLV